MANGPRYLPAFAHVAETLAAELPQIRERHEANNVSWYDRAAELAERVLASMHAATRGPSFCFGHSAI